MTSTSTIFPIIFIALAVLLVIVTAYVVHLHLKLKKFLVGNKAESLGDSISSMNQSIAELETSRGEIENYLKSVEKRLKKSVQAVYTVRFNPFKGTGSGGNQSFATAFINEVGDGVVVSSLYAREHVSIFSKPVKKGASDYELSQEEKEAIAGAMALVS